MALRLSKGLRNLIQSGASMKDALQGGKLIYYTGGQPASADDAPSGTALVAITDASGAHTAEVLATGTATLAGSSGSVNSMTVGGFEVLGTAVAFTTNLTTTAALVAALINANPKNQLVKASSSGAVVTLTMRRGWGALANAVAVVTTLTTMTSTDVNIGSGVAGVSSVNGLKFAEATGAVLSKLSTQTWSGVATAAGVAGYFRMIGSVADSGAADSSELQVRMDGLIATSGGQLNLSSTTIANGSTQTLSAFALTLPTL